MASPFYGHLIETATTDFTRFIQVGRRKEDGIRTEKVLNYSKTKGKKGNVGPNIYTSKPIDDIFPKLLAVDLTTKMTKRLVPKQLLRIYDHSVQCEYHSGEIE